MHDRGVDVNAPRHLENSRVKHCVSGNPERAGLSLPLQREADHVSGDRSAQWGTVPAGGRSHRNGRLPFSFEDRRLPVVESDRYRVPGQSLRAGNSCKYLPGIGEHRPARGIEVVLVMLVRKQDRIDPAEFI